MRSTARFCSGKCRVAAYREVSQPEAEHLVGAMFSASKALLEGRNALPTIRRVRDLCDGWLEEHKKSS